MATESEEDVSLKAGEGRGTDLLTIGLLVFFVALLVVVAALLVLPLIFSADQRPPPTTGSISPYVPSRRP